MHTLVLDRLRAVDRAVARVERAVAMLALLALVVTLTAQVLFRYALQSPLFFAEELAVKLMIVATFIGLSLLVGEGRLVALDLVGPSLGPRARHALETIVRLTVLALAAMLAWYGAIYIADPVAWVESSATLALPRASIYALFTLEMALLCLHQFVRLFDPPIDTAVLPGVAPEPGV